MLKAGHPDGQPRQATFLHAAVDSLGQSFVFELVPDGRQIRRNQSLCGSSQGSLAPHDANRGAPETGMPAAGMAGHALLSFQQTLAADDFGLARKAGGMGIHVGNHGRAVDLREGWTESTAIRLSAEA